MKHYICNQVAEKISYLCTQKQQNTSIWDTNIITSIKANAVVMNIIMSITMSTDCTDSWESL